MKYGVCSDVGQSRRNNQDSYLIDGVCFAVADGMGGHQAGEVASRIAVDVLRQKNWSDPAVELPTALREANERVWQAALSKEEWHGMGTTLTAAVIQDDVIYLGHIGDSRAYVIRDNEIVQLTEDHSVVGELVRNGGLDPEEARLHPQRNVLTRALGTAETVEIDFRRVDVNPGDRLILCTDGLTSVVSENEILEKCGTDPQQSADRLVELANRRGGPDNITVVIIEV